MNEHGQIQTPKQYSTNFQSQMVWESKLGYKPTTTSAMSMQHANYDIISMGERIT